MPRFQAVVGNGGCKVGLTTAANPGEHQPTFRVLSKGFGCSQGLSESFLILGIAASAPWYQVFEGVVGQGTQIAVAFQASQAPLV